jgi:hypothetical protein
MMFSGGELSSIKFEASPDGQLDPIQHVDLTTMKLDGFAWRGDSMPKLEQDFNTRQVTFEPVGVPAWATESTTIPPPRKE